MGACLTEGGGRGVDAPLARGLPAGVGEGPWQARKARAKSEAAEAKLLKAAPAASFL